MKRLDVDFKPRTLPGPRLWIAALICLASAFAEVVVATRERSDLRSAVQTLRETNAAAAASGAPTPPPAAPPYEASARELLRERSVPWPQALATLESVAMRGVVVRVVEFDARKNEVRVEVSARSHAQAIDYLDALNAGNFGGAGELHWGLVQSQSEAGQSGVSAGIVASGKK